MDKALSAELSFLQTGLVILVLVVPKQLKFETDHTVVQ